METPRKTYVTVFGRAPGHFAYELTVQYPSALQPQGWTPAINVFGCAKQIVVCVELAGVEKESIHVEAEPRRLLIRGYRNAPEPEDCEGPLMQVLALEIDHGVFEREIALPVAVDPEAIRAEHRNGLLWIHLPFRKDSRSIQST
jgi:HSP20 family protein